MVYDVEDVFPVPELPDGLWYRGGTIMATCRSCERDYELLYGPEEFDPEYSYCGCGPSCIP